MKTWQINPNTAIALNIVLGVLSALSAPTIHSLGFTADTSVILAWDGMVCLVLNGVLHGYSSSTPGPLAPPDPPSVKAAAVLAAKTASALVLLACLIGLGVLGSPPTARADGLDVAQNGGLLGAAENSFTGKKPGVAPKAPALTGNPAADLQNALHPPSVSATPATNGIVAQVVAGNKAMLAQLSTSVDQLLTLFGTGDAAVTESLQYPAIQDGNGHDCAVAGRQFTQILHDHPLAVTGDFISDLENQRIIFSAANNVCNLNQCRTVFNELSAQVSKVVSSANGAAGGVVGLIPGVGTVGSAVGAAGTAISTANPFTMVCGEITSIALVPPTVTTPVAAPSPTPTSSPTPAAN